jgi:hypothetical protein
MKVGDKVYTYFFNVKLIAEVVEIKGNKARLRFNYKGKTKYHWRDVDTLKKVG